MKIGLIDVDGHNFPNLALMKLSAWHKKQGHEVGWFNGFDYCDRVYMAKVFDFTPEHRYIINAGEIITGGTGYNLKNKLAEEVEKCFPDYSLYNIKETAYGFLTRGCPRGCKFCIVAEKEGKKTTKVADLQDFWNGQKEIKLLDPNLTASKDKEDLFNQLIKSKATVDFTQGLDIRLLTEKDAEQINKIKTKMIHFAWDNYEFKTYEKLKEARAWLKQKDRNITVYVLTNFNTTHEQDLERVYKLKEIGYTPYIMIYNKESAPKITKRLGRWVNNRFIFRACEKFEDYRS